MDAAQGPSALATGIWMFLLCKQGILAANLQSICEQSREALNPVASVLALCRVGCWVSWETGPEPGSCFPSKHLMKSKPSKGAC